MNCVGISLGVREMKNAYVSFFGLGIVHAILRKTPMIVTNVRFYYYCSHYSTPLCRRCCVPGFPISDEILCRMNEDHKILLWQAARSVVVH